MLRSGQPVSSSFGKRGNALVQARRSAAPLHLSGPASPPREAYDPEALTVLKSSSSGSVTRAYIKACAVAFTAVLAVSVAFGGSNNPFAGNSLFQNIVSAVVAPALGGALAVPVFVLAQIVSLLGIRRGVADVLVGGMLGSAWLLLALSDGKPINAVHFAFLLGGCVGGFAFWRAQGYPGANSATAAALDQVYGRVR